MPCFFNGGQRQLEVSPMAEDDKQRTLGPQKTVDRWRP